MQLFGGWAREPPQMPMRKGSALAESQRDYKSHWSDGEHV